MIVYKCKMCNGNLDMQQGKRLLKCGYCDTYQSVPSVIDENKAEMVNRANRYRQNGEFDKATSIYEQILKEDATDPEIHWSIVLCKFGVEYVEDPATKVMKPTINRTQAHSIMHDPDYQNALAIADPETKNYYMTEADKIEKIQRSIWRIAQDADNYDVFISYKEQGPDGRRTNSSVVAQRIYEQLTAAGVKTFYSRVSLASKMGSEYEPYIYSALTSAEIMLVVGSKSDEFLAPWVKNEWSRFRKIANRDTRKKLIPCFFNLTIDDLPDELQPYQAKDLNKDGAEQELIEGVKSLVTKLQTKEAVVTETNEEKLWKNGETFLYLRDFGRAEEIYTELCNREPGDYKGWWGRIRAVTKDFSDEDAVKKNYQGLKTWMGYIKKLAAADVYAKLVEEYTPYLEKASKQMVYEEVETVKKIQAKDYKLAVDAHTELETKLKGKSARQVQLENQYNAVCQSLSNAGATKAAAEASYSSLNTAMLVCGIVGFVFSIIMIIGIVVEVLGLFCSMGSITLILYIFVFANVGKRQTLKFQIDTMTDTLSRNANERDRLEVELQRVIKEENARRTYLNNTLVKCNDVVDASNQYLTYDTQSISRLLYVMMCNDIGESKPVDRKLFDIRQRVFQKVN